MGLKEQLIEDRKNAQLASEASAQQRKENKAAVEKFTAEKQIEVDNLTRLTKEKLVPFLEVVNEIKLDKKGEIKIKTGGPFVTGSRADNVEEYSEPYVEVWLYKELSSSSSPSCYDSYTYFNLKLKINRDKNITIMGASDYKEYALVDMNDENYKEIIENEILTLIHNGSCIGSGGGEMDRGI